MRFIIAPDSFKESLTAKEVACSIKAGLQKIFPNVPYVVLPMADGGEGTVQSLVDAHDKHESKIIKVNVLDALLRPTVAEYGIWKNANNKYSAVIEMAQASGLEKIKLADRNVMKSSSYGTGQLIAHALDQGVSEIIIGIGGSATNDGGAGMAQALGVIFYDNTNTPISYKKLAGGNLDLVKKIDMSSIHDNLKLKNAQVQIQVACDVDNFLCGETGAAAIFAPQKGATAEQVKKLDANLEHFAHCIKKDVLKDVKNIPGAGAAGGLGAGLLAFTDARLRSGIQIVLEAVNFESIVQENDIIITGEGRMDAQSVHGKTPVGVANAAKQKHKNCIVIALCGSLKDDYDSVFNTALGGGSIDAVFPIISTVESLEDALLHAKQNLQRSAENIARLIKGFL